MARPDTHRPGKAAIPPSVNDEPDETLSSSSTLDPDFIDEADRQLGSGHGTDALGPSDTSDSGSDIHGAPGWGNEINIEGLETGTTSDPEQSLADFTAGPDLGDANLDSDSDSSGTGERAAAGRDTVASDGQDINADRIDTIGDIQTTRGNEDKLPRSRRHQAPGGQ